MPKFYIKKYKLIRKLFKVLKNMLNNLNYENYEKIERNTFFIVEYKWRHFVIRMIIRSCFRDDKLIT